MAKERDFRPTWAVYEDDPLGAEEFGLTLGEAFHMIMAHCDYAPVWEENDVQMRLRFRYLDGPFKDRFVGNIPPGSIITTFETPILGSVIAARNVLMERAVKAGLRGFYADHTNEVVLQQLKRQREEHPAYAAPSLLSA